MAITIRVNLAVVAAAVVGELVSIAWQSDALPWGHYYQEHHYIITALVADFTLAVILEWITRYNGTSVTLIAEQVLAFACDYKHEQDTYAIFIGSHVYRFTLISTSR